MSSSVTERERVRSVLETDPANPVYTSFAEELIEESNYQEAISICLAGLSKDQTNVIGRLLLAQAFFESGFIPFAKRELLFIQEQAPESKAVTRLLRLLGAEKRVENKQEEEAVAEVEFEF